MNRLERLRELQDQSLNMARDPSQMMFSFWGTYALEVSAVMHDVLAVVEAAKIVLEAIDTERDMRDLPPYQPAEDLRASLSALDRNA